MKKKKLTPKSAKEKLITYYHYKPCDFYSEGEEIYLNCKDNVMERAIDVYQELQLRIKEEFENELYS